MKNSYVVNHRVALPEECTCNSCVSFMDLRCTNEGTRVSRTFAHNTCDAHELYSLNIAEIYRGISGALMNLESMRLSLNL